jgi:hypothetical protein
MLHILPTEVSTTNRRNPTDLNCHPGNYSRREYGLPHLARYRPVASQAPVPHKGRTNHTRTPRAAPVARATAFPSGRACGPRKKHGTRSPVPQGGREATINSLAEARAVRLYPRYPTVQDPDQLRGRPHAPVQIDSIFKSVDYKTTVSGTETDLARGTPNRAASALLEEG